MAPLHSDSRKKTAQESNRSNPVDVVIAMNADGFTLLACLDDPGDRFGHPLQEKGITDIGKFRGEIMLGVDSGCKASCRKDSGMKTGYTKSPGKLFCDLRGIFL